MSAFVDANLIIRLLTKDDLVKAQDCYELLTQAERGEVDLHASEAIVAEVLFVLSSPRLYGLARSDIALALKPILENQGLKLDHKQSVLQALSRWSVTRLDFPDCVAVEHALRDDDGAVFSYDTDFDRIEGIHRLEPLSKQG